MGRLPSKVRDLLPGPGTARMAMKITNLQLFSLSVSTRSYSNYRVLHRWQISLSHVAISSWRLGSTVYIGHDPTRQGSEILRSFT